MERRRAWAAQQRAWERARRAELGGGYGAQGGEVRREDLPPGTAPPYPQAHGYAPPQPSPYAAPAAPYGYPGAAPYPPAAYGALPPPQQGWY
ncbi:hypothetical protein GCM10010964_04190 [Caldovatus sediminis]|uniref:Uncharacterized protein n=1 Tax=Caldovatus sediminis TaxID=2041189 RepID=A0A8J2Z7P3_9PROT|nr:hypothetical protein [Caldovatus sediminis]GGG19105.1 hypothetical protein GCM10010964_04190 [Caldovatus sediminis]